MNFAVERTLKLAAGEIGVREIGTSNRGKRVDEYQSADTLPGLGYAWCASFIAWIILTALGESLANMVWLRSASCDSILDWARRRGIINATPAVGSAGLVMASRNDATHIFKVTRVSSSGVYTIEGNTNDSGAREGIGVYARFRRHSSRYLYVHWPRLLPKTYQLPDGNFIVMGKPQPRNPLAEMQHWDLFLGDKRVGDVPLIEGRAHVPAWKWAHWFGQELGWDMADQAVTLNGIIVPSQPRLFPNEEGVNRAWVQVTAAAEVTKLKVGSEPGRVLVTR